VIDAERRCRQEAGDSAGAISGGRAVELGMTRHQIKRLVRSGRWRRTHHDVFVIDGVPDSFRQRAAAAASIGAACSHRCAAALYNLDGISAREVEIVVPTVFAPTRFAGDVTVHRTRHLPDDHIREHAGIAVTDVARTILDLGGVVSFRSMRRAAISAVDRALVTPEQMHARFRCCGASGKPGTANLRRLLGQTDWNLDISDSDLEDEAYALITSAGLPSPKRLHRVYEGGILVGELDLAYPDRRIGIEIDSYAFHGPRPDFVRDRGRVNGLQAFGWRIFHFVYEDSLRPRRFLTDLRRALERE
jgi:hypothetical protein